MRCIYCNVDLPDTYKLCPLCGKEASEDEAKIKGLSSVPYSKNPPSLNDKVKKEKSPFCIEKVKAFFNR